MGDFTKRVRDGSIPGPLRRAFAPDRWHRELGNSPSPDDLDHDTHAAGLALHEKLEAVRRELTFSASNKVSATTKLRAFLAIANNQFFATSGETKLALENFQASRQEVSGTTYSLEDMAGVKVRLPGGADWMPDEIIESIVDGIELPIKIVLQSNPSLAGSPRMNQVEWPEVAQELNLGILYCFAKDMWDDCLWNSYKMVDKGGIKIFLPQDLDALNSYGIGTARRASLSIGFNMVAAEFQRGALAEGGRLRVREVCGIERRDRRQFIKVAKHGVSTGLIEELTVMRTYAAEPFYGELLEERLESLSGLSLSQLIDAWTVISRTAHVLVQAIGERHLKNVGNDRVHTWMPEYAPTLQIDALVEALAAATGLNRLEGRRVVDFFTFRGKAGQEIWAQPLVPVGPETVAPVFAAVISPNLRRLIDVWMRQANVDLARRGPLFESHIRKVVADAIQRSRTLADAAACILDDYNFRPPGSREEQIDLIFSIGNTVFVGESKCILEPTDAKGIATHRLTVLGAAKQALRKVKAIEDNRLAFIADAHRFGMILTEQFKVKPLVIVSTSTHVGVAALEVPVIDQYILGRFLDGELEDIAYRPGDTASLKRLKVRFHSTAAEAEERAPDYFRSPPQMKRFIDGLHERTVPMHPANASDWTGFVVTIGYRAGGVPLALQEQANLPTKSDTVKQLTHENQSDH